MFILSIYVLYYNLAYVSCLVEINCFKLFHVIMGQMSVQLLLLHYPWGAYVIMGHNVCPTIITSLSMGAYVNRCYEQ